jgi:CRISPR system Cascade subunit CasB
MEDVHPFIRYLNDTLAQDRGALAALRRGLGQPPGQAPEMIRFIAPFISDDTNYWREQALYMVASLFGLHPSNTPSGNMGDHFEKLKSGDDTALERRFTALLSSHPEELNVYLRQAVGVLKSKEIPVNWDQLLQDVTRWGYPESRDRVRRDWAYRFWRAAEEPTVEDTSAE